MEKKLFYQWSDFYLAKCAEFLKTYDAEVAAAAEDAELGRQTPESQFPISLHNLHNIARSRPENLVRILYANNKAAFATIAEMIAQYDIGGGTGSLSTTGKI